LTEHQTLLLQTPQPWSQVLDLKETFQFMLPLCPMARQALQYLPCPALRPGLRLGLGCQGIDRFCLDAEAFRDSRLEHLSPGAEIILRDPACELEEGGGQERCLIQYLSEFLEIGDGTATGETNNVSKDLALPQRD
jgi:hypothetical protein